MNTRGRKAKGRGLCLEVKAWLHAQFPEFPDHDVIVPASSANGEDLIIGPELRKVFPYSIECKRTEGLAQDYKFMEQARDNADKHTPIVIMRSNHKEALVMMYLKDWEKLL
jgi:hypothetical protein